MLTLGAAEKPGPETNTGSKRSFSDAQGIHGTPPTCVSKPARVEPTELKSDSDKQQITNACSDDRCAFSSRINNIHWTAFWC